MAGLGTSNIFKTHASLRCSSLTDMHNLEVMLERCLALTYSREVD